MVKPSIEQTARFVALASVLQIAEAFLPHPIPGVRLGLANAITLIALVRFSSGCALEIALLRTVLSSLALGTFLAPTFIISFFAALCSTAAMIFFHAIFARSEKKYFSLISVSLLGAVSHNLVQLLLAYLLIVRHQSIFLLAPWLGLSAVLTGWLTGLIALSVCRKLAAVGEQCSAPAILLPKESALGETSLSGAPSSQRNFSLLPVFASFRSFRVNPALKIICLLFLALLVLFTNSFVALGFILLGLLGAGYTVSVSCLPLLRGLARKGSLILISFLMPALFQTNGNILWLIGPLTITREGLLLGALFASRLGLLLLGATLLGKTTAPQDLARGLEQIIRPLSLVLRFVNIMTNDCVHFCAGQGGESGGVPERSVPLSPTPPGTKMDPTHLGATSFAVAPRSTRREIPFRYSTFACALRNRQNRLRHYHNIYESEHLVGVNARRIAAILAQSLLELPELEHKARERLALGKQEKKSSQHLIPRLIDGLADLCQPTELNGRLVPETLSTAIKNKKIIHHGGTEHDRSLSSPYQSVGASRARASAPRDGTLDMIE